MRNCIFLPWKAAASPPEAGGQHFLSGSRGGGSRGSALDLTRKGLLFHGMTNLFFAGGRQQLPRWRPSASASSPDFVVGLVGGVLSPGSHASCNASYLFLFLNKVTRNSYVCSEKIFLMII